MKKLLYMFGILCIIFSAEAKVTAKLSRSSVAEGQSVELVLTSDQEIKTAPQLGMLKADFVLGGQGAGQQTIMVNGKLQASYFVSINLLPLKSGKITIPALSWGAEKTAPILLDVQSVSSQASGLKPDQDLFIKASVEPKIVYEGQQVVYKISIYDRAGLVNGDYAPPVLKGAEIQPVGRDEITMETHRDLPYQVYTRTYVLFPGELGDVTIHPASFRGHIYQDRMSQRDFFGMELGLIYADIGSQQREVFVKADPIQITVKPRPKNMQGKWWLPSLDVRIDETYAPNYYEVRAGDAITRTVTVKARGVLGSQLPDLTLKADKGFKVYPGKSKKENYYDAGGLMGIMEQSFVIVPVENGHTTIPALSVAWFDVASQKEKYATLPSKDIQIFGAQETSIGAIQQMAPAPLIQAHPYAKENSWLFFVMGMSLSGLLAVIIYIFWGIKNRKKKKPLKKMYPF